MANEVLFKKGLYADYMALVSKDPDTFYYCTDTNQVFLGTETYSPFPECPTTTDGTFTLQSTISSGTRTYSWGGVSVYDGTVIVI